MIKVFTNGCFDLFHPGHLHFLQTARRLGNQLFVAVNSDASVQRLKGPLRPIYPQSARLELLGQLRCVDQIALFDDEEELSQLIQQQRPDILAKGSDWQGKPITGAKHVGRVEFLPHLEGWSTSSLLRQLRKK